MAKVTLNPLTPDDREQFIQDNQEAFNYGALEEFGLRDDHFEEDGEIISMRLLSRLSTAVRHTGSYKTASWLEV